uniref:Fe-S metabolism associated domain-containing protein n=1 Tax=Leptocylindrus danicus TaxID=163516 RepID=A0A7S2NSI8_9STRA
MGVRGFTNSRTFLRKSYSSASTCSHRMVTSSALNAENLTPELEMMTAAFARMPDEKLRYKQLMFLAQKLAPMPDNLKIDANKVPGCLSTVHVHATLDDSVEPPVVNYTGDSDGILTKGLVALLVRGLSGNTAEVIDKVTPDFVNTAGISASLTPGRNNGFLNMLATMKKQANEVTAGATTTATNEEEEISSASIVTSFDEQEGRPMYNAMMSTLINFLKPTSINLVDNSHQHAGHAGSKGYDGESHFELEIVAECFDGLALVKRHQLIYTILGEIMPKIHALQIKANTPEEVAGKVEA